MWGYNLKFAFLIAVLCAITVPSFGAELQATMIDQTPKIDGSLDDSCWQRVPDTGEFTHNATSTPAAEKTEAWICYDSTYIYAAFRCHDSQPDKIIAQQKKRGGSISTDDKVILGIDPWHEHKTIYYFYLTPRGTQVETIPGSGGNKIEWTGDWLGAAKQDDKGWTAEMAIPWSILKYPKDQKTIGISFWRRHARLDLQWCYPSLGINENDNNMLDWTGIDAPAPKLHGTTLHYTNVGVGGVRFRNGLDIKRQLSQEVNGLITVNPDFDSIEQDVESIDFTYSPRVLSDNRPFFEEGGSSHQDGEYRMFYSRDIEEVDAGAKITGQTAKQRFAGLFTTGGRHDSHFFYKSRWDLGRINQVGFATTSTREQGNGNSVVSAYGRLGKKTDKRRDYCEYRLMKSYSDGPGGDGMIIVTGMGGEGGPRQLSWGIWYQDVDPNYCAADGIVSEPDLKGWDYHLGVYDNFEKGRIRGYWTGIDGHAQHLHSGDLLSRGLYYTANLWGVGWQVYAAISPSTRRQQDSADSASYTVFDDREYTLGYGWTQNDIYRRGWVDLTFGRAAGGRSMHVQGKQAFVLGGGFHSDFSVEYLKMTGPYAQRRRQSIASISYDLSSERSLSARVIERNGTLNLSFGFRQAVRRGQDIYLLFGDPNADQTINRVVLKLIRPVF
jgi:hypothetical protein